MVPLDRMAYGAVSSDEVAGAVQRILAQKCLTCHGPGKQEGGLRLDRRDSAMAELASGDYAIVAGDVEASALLRRVAATDPDIRMPPDREPLAQHEVAELRQWIVEGAEWQVHWAYRPLDPLVPADSEHGDSEHGEWGITDIDRFVLSGLRQNDLVPSPRADRYTLAKRLYYDLLGLPPTPAAVDRFVQDPSADAYEQLVDELLDSPHFGERWGRRWLDKARYADSDGYEKDSPRLNAWRYRDWVIDSINTDLPFDEFTIKQLAGDLQPDATPLDRLATAFHRQTLTNTEGGTDQEEFRIKAVVDRVNTTGTVWLGLTVGCAQCHNHKYDRISQQEYYELFAFFNNGDEAASDVVKNQFLSQEKATKLEVQRTELRRRLDERRAALAEPVRQREQRLVERLSASQPELTILSAESTQSAGLLRREDGSYLVSDGPPERIQYAISGSTTAAGVAGVRLHVLTDPSLPAHGPGRASNGNFVLTEIRVRAGTTEGLTDEDQVGIASAMADHSQDGWPVAAAIDGDNGTGWGIAPQSNKDHQATFLFDAPLWQDTVGGEPRFIQIELDQQHGQQHAIGRFRIELVHYRETVPPPILAIVDLPRVEWSESQRYELDGYLLADDADYTQLRKQVSSVEAEIDEALGRGETMSVRVIEQRESPRTTHILARGDFQQPGKAVTPGTLAVLSMGGESPFDRPRTRLELAQWLFSPDNPLVPRVAANDVWAALFGQGLVRTINDFGLRGEPPTHPRLLDWLAVKYRELGWSRKALIKTIVMSMTYQQSSVISHARDPENRWLSRQNRLRVEAEIVRDLFLSASGLLSTKMGGPSVYPPLPPGIAELSYASQFKWTVSEGDDRYRRGLYTFFKRTAPHPNLMTFDCPDANTTNVQRRVSNTPLAALTTLNNEVFVESARALAAGLLQADFADDTARMNHAIRLCIARPPSPLELAEALSLLEQSRAYYFENVSAAEQMVSEHRPDGVAVEEVAAWVATSRIVLNLDEFITRE